MKAMIFAAGLGTRLKPYTDRMPKALVPVAGIPMIEHVILRLKAHSIKEIIINVHHFAEQVIDFIHLKHEFGIHIEVSDETDFLLDTGGGLKKASWFFDDGVPFILHNVDVLSSIDIEAMIGFHAAHRSISTLAVSKRESSRYFLFDREMRLCGWENNLKNEQVMSINPGYELSKFAFSGIHIIDPRIFEFMNEKGRFSLVDVYLRLTNEHPVYGFAHNANDWIDLGRPSDVERAGEMIREGRFGLQP
jgi:N-acetyl-alpha-D-muramate 1-phosphate uridylyltransferase